MREARLFIDSAWVDGAHRSRVLDKYRGEPIAVLHHASSEQVAAATRAAAEGQRRDTLTPYERFTVLQRASLLLRERADDFARTIMRETGFTLSDSGREVGRAAETLLICAEEAKRINGETVPLDGAPGVTNRLGFTVRRPLGVVVAITPFNSPLNTVLHKVGPALAGGNAIVLKPAALTPLTGELIVQLLLDAGLPPSLIALVHGDGRRVGAALLADRVPRFYAFTGSTEVGAQIAASVGFRRTQLEMGSLSSTIICADAVLEHCVDKCVTAAFRKAGQICTSIQRLYVQRGVAEAVVERLRAALDGRVAGDPSDPDSFIGPLITAAAAERVGEWIDEARSGGASVVCGGGRDGAVVQPTVLTDVAPNMQVMRQEIFGPVVVIRPFDALADAIDEANATPYGLAAGIFTRDLEAAFDAAERLEMGSVHVNETSNGRVDLMPYSGAKASGIGREGPRYAIEEMTEERLITVSRP